MHPDEKISKRGTESTFEEKLVDRVSKMDDLNKIAVIFKTIIFFSIPSVYIIFYKSTN